MKICWVDSEQYIFWINEFYSCYMLVHDFVPVSDSYELYFDYLMKGTG